ncbi:MAG: PL29 family lyase N-terminal domain-containing protein [Candidatus Cryptobacteroides sp.]
MKTIFKYITIAFAALFVLGCNQLDDLTKRVDELESKVNAALAQVEKINANIEALQALAEATTINMVEENGGVYTITLSNGEKLTLNQGAVGVGNAPIMSIDKDGYWMVDYGNGAEYLLVNGEKVKARGENGAAPQFGVNAAGNWTVSYNGSEPKEVLGADGKPVSAINGDAGDPYFNDVDYTNGKFTLTLKDGSVIELPVVPDFLFAIKDAEGEQVFEAGKSKVYTVEQKGIASASIIAYPEGWKAELDETTLTVTAPMATKVAADTETDIAVLAISGKGFSTIAKIQVKLDGTVVVTTPVASVAVGEATSSSLVYNVTLKNAVAYKYIHRLASEPAPTLLELTADGTESTETALLVEGLASETEYALYVLPYDSEKTGEIVKTTHKTTEKTYATLYDKFMDGGAISISGVDYTIDMFEGLEAKVISAASEDKTITGNGIYFIDSDATATFSGTGAISRMLIIGNNPAARSKIVVDQYVKLNFESFTGTFACYNMIFDGSQTKNAAAVAGYVLTLYKNGIYETVSFDNCKIITLSTKPFIYSGTSGRSIENINFKDSEISIDNKQTRLIATANKDGEDYPFGTLKLENSIVYNTNTTALPTDFKLILGDKAVSFKSVILERNTLVNATPSESVARLIYIKSLSQLTAKDNLFFAGLTYSKYIALAQGVGTAPTTGEISHNVGYLVNDGFVQQWQGYYGGAIKTLQPNWTGGTLEEVLKLTADPFEGGTFDVANCIFKPASEYASYGAQR